MGKVCCVVSDIVNQVTGLTATGFTRNKHGMVRLDFFAWYFTLWAHVSGSITHSLNEVEYELMVTCSMKRA